MSKPFDISEFRKSLTKSIPGIGVGTHDPTAWVSVGNYAANWLITGDFYKGLPLGKVMTIAGQPGAGKSYFATNAVRDALAQGMYVILMDSEFALDAEWLSALGVDPNHPNLLKIDVSELNDVAGTISNFFETYRTKYVELAEEDRPEFLIVVDSLGMLLTPTDIKQFEDADMKGDKGLKARMLYSLIRNCVAKFGSYNIGMLATNHTYESQNMFEPGQKMSGGGGFWFASSIVLMVDKLTLRDGTVTQGIRSKVTQRKSRFNHKGLLKSYEVYIRTDTGMDPYSGLESLLSDLKILHREPKKTKYRYIDPNTGELLLYSSKELTPEVFERIMQDYNGKLPMHDELQGDADAGHQQRDEDDLGDVGAYEGAHSGKET